MRNIKLITVLLFISLIATNSNLGAQTQFGNEWINFNQTYFKIKVGQSGIYRIPFSVLQDNGLGAVPGAQFALYRDGQEEPIYVSNNGSLVASDYIEFYGQQADGKMDKELYIPTSWQANDEINIISDTATYFLTYSTGSHLRLNLKPNTIGSGAPIAEPYFITDVYPNENIRDKFSNGADYYLNSSSQNYYLGKYDKGEGFGYIMYKNSNLLLTFNPLKNKTLDNPKLTFSFLLDAVTTNSLNLLINNNSVFDTTLEKYSLIHKSVTINNSGSSLLNNPINLTLVSNANKNLLKVKISYKRTFDFDSIDNILFKLDNYNQIQKLKFNKLNLSNQNIVVDKTTNNIYHLGSDSSILLDASASERDLCFSANAFIINELNSVSFRNYNEVINQGTYIILSDDEYIDIPNGGVNQYKAYRSSLLGGNYNVLVVSANELYNQFAYGMDYHPLAIKHFIQYIQQNSTWVQKPEHFFIIGKGIFYNLVEKYKQNKTIYNYPIIPTFGTPGSDVLFAEIGNSNVPSLAVGRLSVVNNNEILEYLNKVQLYEQAQSIPSFPNLENSLWKKRALHIPGGSDQDLLPTFNYSLDICKNILQDTLIGAIVSKEGKGITPPGKIASLAIDSLLELGTQYLTFYGHASAMAFDYNLNNPEQVHSNPKFPIILAYGCDLSAIFNLTNGKTISERYLLEGQGGAIAMLACTADGWTGYIEPYMQGLYSRMAKNDYGKTLGTQIKKNLEFYTGIPLNYYFTKGHMQTFLLQGDPAIKAFSPEKPDYYIDSSLVTVNPKTVSTTMDSFEIKAQVYNLGKALNQNIKVLLTKNKEGENNILYSDSVFIKVLSQNTISFQIPIDKINDLGMFEFKINVNSDQSKDEQTHINNQANIKVYISNNNLKPIFPSEFSIVHSQGVELKASTDNAFIMPTDFILEIDTTQYFNSPFKKTKTLSSIGGVIKWIIPFQMEDSTVYYWRTSTDTLIEGETHWYYSSFVFLQNGSDGWNQSHFFQYLQDSFQYIGLKEPTRNFEVGQETKPLSIASKYWPDGNNDTYLGDDRIGLKSCLSNNTNGMMFVLLNSITGEPLKNTNQFAGSKVVCAGRNKQFEFYVNTPAQRKDVMNFIDSIPNNYYIIFKSDGYLTTATTPFIIAQEWLQDDTLGIGKSLYHSLYNLGFTNIDLLDAQKPYAGITQKGNPNFNTQFILNNSNEATVNLGLDLIFPRRKGSIKSTLIGPANAWTKLLWNSKSIDSNAVGDNSYIRVLGFSNPNSVTGDTLFTTTNKDTILSTLSASQYPYLRLEWVAEDSVNYTLPQLEFWRVMYEPLPEGAINPIAAYEFPDTFQMYDDINFKVAFENLTSTPMDSMLVKFKIKNFEFNTITDFGPYRFNPLAGNDTIMLRLNNISNVPFSGQNILYLEVNPDEDQPEAYHPNNLGYFPFYVNNFPTPIKLINFDATKKGTTALLKWETNNMQDLKGYEIQRSKDGAKWEQIGYTNPKFTKDGAIYINYEFIDSKPHLGLNFYRLNQLFLDGKNIYSEIKNLLFKEEHHYTFLPNPVYSSLEISGLTTGDNIVFYDITGKKVESLIAPSKKVTIKMENFAEGTYQVVIMDKEGNTKESRKIVKLK
ncbi:MAG TPA: C25 family cysteine peptidase [Edaphocola sp.]|nr:C25 family cysteine peptidase [Edaphocola sp.]